jgi:exosortase/archaeosortase family protein
VPTAITPTLTSARSFVLRGVAASLALFALLRLAWIDAHVVLPFTAMQAALASRGFGAPASPIGVTLACSGTDAITLCAGAILAYPARWRTRAGGLAAGVILIAVLNTIRIGTLGRAAASPSRLAILHLYLWPAVLTLAIAGYVFAWMRYADRADPQPVLRVVPRPTQRFIVSSVVFFLVFLAASPYVLVSGGVLALANVVAHAAAALLRVAGVPAHAAASVLWTGSGGFLVTQECIATPLIPVYLAAVCAYAPTWRRLTAGVVATLPLFVALGIVRLLLVALPSAVASPLFWVHAFYQLLLGAIIVCVTALWRDRRTAGRHALAGMLAGVVAGVITAPLLAHLTGAVVEGVADPQGAIALLPAFQIALYVALCAAAWTETGWTRAIAGLTVVSCMIPASMLILRALAADGGVAPHVRDIRGWAIAGPVLIFAAVTSYAPARR